MRIAFFRLIAWQLVLAMLVLGMAPGVEAGLVPSELINPAADRVQDMSSIQKTIESKMVQERLEKLGFTAAEVKSRLERLSDQQLHQLALNRDDLQVAGDDGLGIIVVLLVIAILVVILLQLTGHKVIVR